MWATRLHPKLASWGCYFGLSSNNNNTVKTAQVGCRRRSSSSEGSVILFLACFSQRLYLSECSRQLYDCLMSVAINELATHGAAPWTMAKRLEDKASQELAGAWPAWILPASARHWRHCNLLCLSDDAITLISCLKEQSQMWRNRCLMSHLPTPI